MGCMNLWYRIKQQEIDVLVEKTLQRIGELIDIEPDEALDDGEDQMKNKKKLKEKKCFTS